MTERLTAWEVMMSIKHPLLVRPRFFSIHTIATVIDRKDIIELADELKNSGKVAICHCPVVVAPVLYLMQYASTYGNYISTWDKVKPHIAANPFPKIKGFQAREGHWSGNRYGVGQYIVHKPNFPLLNKTMFMLI
jgi:hypothetical protein